VLGSGDLFSRTKRVGGAQKRNLPDEKTGPDSVRFRGPVAVAGEEPLEGDDVHAALRGKRRRSRKKGKIAISSKTNEL